MSNRPEYKPIESKSHARDVRGDVIWVTLVWEAKENLA